MGFKCGMCMENGREGGSTIVALWDANNAYPSIWQNGVDWLMYKGGVRGRLWRILRDMERGLESQVRVNGNMIKIKRHERGANQGAVAPPHRWKFIMAEWLYECERREMGTEIGGERIPGLGYVDDVSTMTEEVSELINMKFHREVFGRKWGMGGNRQKMKYIVRGERKGAKKKEEDMRKTGMKTKKEVKVLGELIGWDPARCPGQVQAAYKKMKGAAKTLEWMVWRGSVVDADILERLFDAIVGSLAAAHLIHTRITKGEEKRIEAIKAGMAKRFLGVGKRASATGAMLRVGWTSVMVGVWKAKLAFYWRLRTAEGLVRRILDKTIERMEEKADIEFSGRVGFLKEVKEMLAETKMLQYWGKGGWEMKKRVWKRIVKEALGRWETEKRERWRRQKRISSQRLIVETGKNGNLRKEGERGIRALIATTQLMVTRGCGGGAEGCEMCSEEEEGNTEHVVLRCKKWEVEREEALGRRRGRMGKGERWRKLTEEKSGREFLKKIQRGYREELGVECIPWVDGLGRNGAGDGVWRAIRKVAKWLEKEKQLG